MVAEFKRFPLEKAEPTPGMQIMIATVKADPERLVAILKLAHQKTEGYQALTSEEQAALTIEDQERAIAKRKAREAATEAKRHGIGAQIWNLLGEIW